MIDVKNLPHLSGDDVARLLDEQGYAIGVMNPDEYHETKKRFPISLSKSNLCKAIDSTLKYHLTKDDPLEESKAIKFGQTVDCLLLTPELFDGQYMRVPEKISLATKPGKALKAEAEAQGKKIFWESDSEVELMAAKNAGELLASELDDAYTAQVAMWVKTPADGEYGVEMVISGMIDILPHEPHLYGVWDLKTTSKDLNNLPMLYKHMSELHYGVQAAMYIDMLRECGVEVAEIFSFLFVGSSKPCHTRLVQMIAHDIERYRTLYLSLLSDVAKCYLSGEWGYHVLPSSDYEAPRWEDADLAQKGFEL